jgi:HisJ family histidinol phosphate phosphatase
VANRSTDPTTDPRTAAIPDVHGHAKGEHRAFSEERPIAYSARMLFLWFYHACRRFSPRFLMVADHANYLTFEDPGAVATVRRALKLAQAGDLLGAAETAGVDIAHASVVSEGLRRGMRFAIGAEIDNDPRARPDAQNIVDALRPDGIIRTVHFVSITHPEKGADWAWPFDSEEFAGLHEVVGPEKLWELYTAKLFDDLEKLPAHIVGHFYVPATLGRWPNQKSLEEYEDRLLDICHQRGLAVEFNTRFLYRDHPEERKKKYLEANARLVRKAKARGVGIAIGSDAHSPKDQGNCFGVVLEILDEARVNEVVFPVAGRLARVALRATREHLEAQAQAHRQPSAPGSSITGFSRAELGLPEESETAAGHREGGRAGRESGPKKRAVPPTPSSSRRSADSSSSALKAKAARLAKPAPAPKKKAAEKPVRPVVVVAPKAKKAVAKPPRPEPKKAAAPASRVKKAPVRKSAAKKTPATKAAGGKAAPKKVAVKKAAVKKAAVKKVAAKKAVPRQAAKPKRPVAARANKTVKKKKPAAKRR